MAPTTAGPEFSFVETNHVSASAMEVQRAGDVIRLQLRAKPGETFDTRKIAASLGYTTAKLTELQNQN